MSQEIFELLRADNTIYANRTLAAAVGLNEAVIYSALLGKEYYYRTAGQLDGEGMFYSTASDLETSTTLTQRQQDRAVKRLEELGLIYTKLKGMPAKKYFKINLDTEILLSLLREKTNPKPPKKANNDKGSDDGNSDTGSDADDSDNSAELQNAGENSGETSFNKTSKQDSTEQQTLIQQNVETSMDETSKQGSTKGENMNRQNSETFLNIYNKNINKKSNKKNTARARDETANPDNLSNDFFELITSFTENEKVRAAIAEYIKMRLQRPRTVTTDYTVSLALNRLTELSHDPDTQIKILNQSILNSYPDLYELKKGGEYVDYRGRITESRGSDKPHITGRADRKTDGRPLFPGVVKLG